MAPKSKIKSPKTKPTTKTTSKPELPNGAGERTDFWCCRCARYFKKQKGNFPSSQSTINYGNGGYLPICNFCLEDLFSHYKAIIGDEKLAIRRICQKFDIYWHEDIYDMSMSVSSSISRIRAYITKSNIYRYLGKTYDDTLDEEAALAAETEEENLRIEREKAEEEETKRALDEESAIAEQFLAEKYSPKDDAVLSDEDPIDPDVYNSLVRYWGRGLDEREYFELEERRQIWLESNPNGAELTPAEDALLKQICTIEVDINHERAAGRPVDKLQNTYNTYLGSINWKPSQTKQTEESNVPFGVEIARWEDEQPVIEPDPAFQDVDGIRRNLLAWFLGGLCDMVGINNRYSELFKEETEKYTVERPSFDDDEYSDEDSFDSVFGANIKAPGDDDEV